MTYNIETLGKLFTENELDFIENLSNKQVKNKNDIKVINLKKEEIVKSFTKNKSIFSKDSKKLQNYLKIFESCFDSTKQVLQNLNELQTKYNDIEKKLLIIIESKKCNIDNKYLKEYQNSLTKEICILQTFEIKSQEKNEKNLWLINNFLDKSKFKETENNNTFERITTNSNCDIQDNLVLKISEKEKCVNLPYTKEEIKKYLDLYPDTYKNAQDVIFKEYKMHISLYNNHPVLARFRETYNLYRNKEMKSIIDSLSFAKSMMFKKEINPSIIAAVKSSKQLEDYIYCLKTNTLDKFKYFKIIFEVNPV